MKNFKKIIEQFNKPETHLVVSDYPFASKKGEKNHGIAWYTKELIEPIAKNFNEKFVVLAEKTDFGDQPQLFTQNRVLVLRIFDHKKPRLFPQILRWLMIFNKINDVSVHSEFCANGGIRNMVLLLPFLFLIRLAGRKITFFAHNVVTDLSFVSDHLNLGTGWKIPVLNWLVKIYYKILSLLVSRFVVMDEVVKNRLRTMVGKKEIIVNPFWVKPHRVGVNQEKAKKILGFKKNDFLMLCFGFISHYKGSDWIVKTVKKLNRKNLKLLLAGGPAYSLKEKPLYREYYQKLCQLVKQDKRIQITGFVPEDKVVLYFTAADLVVLPYRGLIGGSGTLIHALSYRKPLILSNLMAELLKSHDIQKIFADLNLTEENLTFAYNLEDFSRILKELENPSSLRKLAVFSQKLAKEKSFQKLIEDCYNKLYAPQKDFVSNLALSGKPSFIQA